MEEKTCRTCRWWGLARQDNKLAESKGLCGAPLPISVKHSAPDRSIRAGATNCPCWADFAD